VGNANQDIAAAEKKSYTEKMFLDMHLFAKVILSHHMSDETPTFHHKIYRLLDSNKTQRKAVIAPRGHSKSTISSLIYPLWNIVFKRKNFIIIVSESYAQSVLFLDAIKRELEENEKLRYFFGNLVGVSKWSENSIVTSSGIMVVAKGSGQRMRGLKYKQYRPDLVVLDDFESEDNTATPESRKALFRWINGAVLPGIDPHVGEIVLIGTIVHNDSYLENIHKIGNKTGWKVLYFQAMDEDKQTTLWPTRFSFEKLEEIKLQYASQGLLDMFYMEYQNIAQDPEGRPFTEDMLQYYVGSIFNEEKKYFLRLEDGNVESVNLYCGVDPAMGKDKGDWTVIMITAITQDGKVYLIEYDRAKTKPVDLINKLFDYFIKYNKNLTFIIETIAYQEALVDFARDYGRRKGYYLPILEVKPRNSKSERLLMLQPYFADKRVFMRTYHQEFVEELMTFPKGKHDDTLDAFWNTLQFTSRPSHIYQKVKKAVQRKMYDWMVQ